MIKRYSLPDMAKIWEDQTKFSKFLQIEILTCEALAKSGNIPKQALSRIKKKAKFNIKGIDRLEKKTNHDVVAFVNNVAQYIGPEAKYLHRGITSSDLLDTTLALQCRDAADILITDIDKLLKVIKKQAIKYKDTACIGRSHGVHAEPITFGLKLAVWYAQMQRNLKRLIEAKEEISVGKISGAVGTYAHINPSVEAYVCKKLGLKAAKISTQIISRDVHAKFMNTLSVIASSLEQFATEIRNLQKTEVLEVEEPFKKGQKGSSAMPHKRNPIICERICGLARILRANAHAAGENLALWHERDISHSSVERIILPDSTTLLDYMLNKFIAVVDGLLVYPENMLGNIAKTRGLVFSQKVLVTLMQKGLPREKAYDLVQKNSMLVWRENLTFQDALLKDKNVLKYLKPSEIRACFNLQYYLRYTNTIFKRLGLR